MEIVNETVSDLDYDKIDVNYDFSVNCEQFEVSKSSRADVLSSTPRKSNFNVKEHINSNHTYLNRTRNLKKADSDSTEDWNNTNFININPCDENEVSKSSSSSLVLHNFNPYSSEFKDKNRFSEFISAPNYVENYVSTRQGHQIEEEINNNNLSVTKSIDQTMSMADINLCKFQSLNKSNEENITFMFTEYSSDDEMEHWT